MWTNYIIFKKFENFDKKYFKKKNCEGKQDYYRLLQLLYFKLWNLQNNIVSWHYNVDLAMVLQYIRFQAKITRNYEDFNLKISLIRTPNWL
jgi:hypothetical protein